VDCQSSGYVSCEAELKGRCDIGCSSTGEGGVFCDNQYIDHGGNLEKCVNALKQINIDVEGSAQGSCMNGVCQGTAEGSASCALSRPGLGRPGEGTASGLLLAFGAALAFGARRRRR
jgi:hypothetical protein